jgi:hypothetical protein
VIIEPDITGASVVLVGNFNPAILSPDWFVRQNLIKDVEVVQNDAEYIVHPQVSQFKLDWCQVVSEPNRFTISGMRAPFIRLADLAAKTFGELLPHTPIRQLAMTRQVHFRVKSIDARDAFGYQLAPPDAWGAWGDRIKARSNETRGGLRALTMQQRVFDSARTGSISATVEPSNLLPKGVGVFVQINDTHDLPEVVATTGARAAAGLLLESFDASMRNAEAIIDHLMEMARAAGE